MWVFVGIPHIRTHTSKCQSGSVGLKFFTAEDRCQKARESAVCPTSRRTTLSSVSTMSPEQVTKPACVGSKAKGYQRKNGRWEARFRPQSKWLLTANRATMEAYKGFSKGAYKYEFLNCKFFCFNSQLSRNPTFARQASSSFA